MYCPLSKPITHAISLVNTKAFTSDTYEVNCIKEIDIDNKSTLSSPVVKVYLYIFSGSISAIVHYYKHRRRFQHLS